MNISENISTLSFVDKDFPALYMDVLDLAKKLTNDWDPSKSNESDPAIVLLKLATFLADHLNYNIDKNTLENFLPTATQESSVRNLVAMNGYTPRYYMSANGDITFVYNPETALTSSVTIPAYSITITNDKSDIVYTQIEPLLVLPNKISSSCKFIEGTKVDLVVNGDKNILLENIDDNNRLYIPTKNIAQNGINVISTSTATTNIWQEVHYLNTMPLGSYVYKLGYDSNKEIPYLEFPTDVANLIGSGLNISYIVTSGINGNVAAETLTKIQSIDTTGWTDALKALNIDSNDFRVTNTLPFINGKNPETIDEMYKSFKQIVGTFDTLVTRLDYKNKIRSAQVADDYLVSNCNVTDYLTDFNNSTGVVTLNSFGEYTEHITKNKQLNLLTAEPSTYNIGDAWISDGLLKVVVGKDSSGNAITKSLSVNEAFNNYVETMTPYDLCIYAFRAYENVFSDNTVNNALTYVPVKDDIINEIKNVLENSKSINHIIKSPNDGDIIMVKNNVPLNVTIMPYNKVTDDEANNIISAATNFVAKKFAANNLEFGKELDYDNVLQAFINSDDRIKDARLEDFTYEPSIIIKDSSSTTGFTKKKIDEYMTSIVAKNVLAGKLSMFNADKMISFPFESADRETFNNVKTISPSLKISTTYNLPLKGSLSTNENIHILWPSTIEDVVYPAYVNYKCTLKATIAANIEYELQDGESLIISYTKNGEAKTTQYATGTIIKASFDLINSANTYIPTGNTISIMRKMETIVDFPIIYCTWNRKNATNTLFVGTETEVILGTGEFFAYSNEELTTFIFFGTGTKLIRSSDIEDSSWTLDIGEVDSNSISKLKNVWKQMNLSSSGSGNVTCKEMNYLTLGEGYKFEIDGIGDNKKYIDNTWNTCTSIKYQSSIDTDFTSLSGHSYDIKTSLAINCGPNNPQKIADRNDITGDTTTCTYDQSVAIGYNDTTSTITNKSIISSIDINLPGDNIIESTVDDLIIDTLKTGSAYSTTLVAGGNTSTLVAVNNSYYITTDEDSVLTGHLSYDKTKSCIIPIYITSGTIKSITQSYSEYIFNGDLSNISGPKLINLYIAPTPQATTNNKLLTINIGANTNIQILEPIVYDGLNNSIIKYNNNVEINKITEVTLINEIKSIIENSSNVDVRPRLKATVHNDNAIQIDDLSDSNVLFDINNVINQYVLPAIDFKNSNIGIYKSMRLLK